MKKISDKEMAKAFEILHDYCDERECKECIFLNDFCDRSNLCVLRDNTPAYLHIDEIPVVTYKIKRG